jgi:integrase/recombinase XerD
MTTALATKTPGHLARKKLNLQRKPRPKVAQALPEYLYPQEVEALIKQASHAQARLVMLSQWRAGLRVSKALALEVADLDFTEDNPTLRVRKGRGISLDLSRCTRSWQWPSGTTWTTPAPNGARYLLPQDQRLGGGPKRLWRKPYCLSR